jgi:hypothetical protein
MVAMGLAMAFLAACSSVPASRDPMVDLGAFRLGHNVVVASKAQKGPVSRDATEEEWVTALRGAVQQRFGRYEGDQLYHFGISVEGYMLAPPGVPVLYKPRSALIVNVTIWDDAANRKLNEEVEQFTIFESTTSGSFLVGSGYERTKEEQMAGLAANAMREIEEWMLEQKATQGWFEPRPGAATEARVTPQSAVVPQE